jgi:hypothetical protein
MNRITLQRRRFLQALGLGAGSLFLPSLRGRAQTAAPPKRFVVVFTQHGFVYNSFRMRPAGTTDTADFNVSLADVADGDFSRMLRPLAPFKRKLLVVDGLSMASAEGDIAFNEHDKGTRGALTGAPIQRSNGTLGAGGASIDQLIAEQIRVPGRIDSLGFAVTGPSSGGAIWRGPMQAPAARHRPSRCFRTALSLRPGRRRHQRRPRAGWPILRAGLRRRRLRRAVAPTVGRRPTEARAAS